MLTFHCRDSVGRPRLIVNKEDIQSLRRLNYSWTKIARLPGISRHTLYRRLKEYDIPTDGFTNVSELELDELLRDIKAGSPNFVEVMLQGRLLHIGIKVSRAVLWAEIHRVDHANTVQRESHVISRRVYFVSQPNAVWHIDGNHKQ